jgi:N-acetylneuraminic acid mutarotase
LRGINKIATLGGNLGGKISKLGYLFDPTDFTKAQPLPEFPVPIRYTTLAFYNGALYSIGGDTEGADPKENVMKEVYKLQITPEVGKAWEKVCDLPIARRAANVMVANDCIYVFGGYSGAGLRSTQIDVVDLKAKTSKSEAYRLPLGVEGARQCWFGDDILLIGGKRLEDKNDANVVQVDFLKTAIMSLR